MVLAQELGLVLAQGSESVLAQAQDYGGQRRQQRHQQMHPAGFRRNGGQVEAEEPLLLLQAGDPPARVADNLHQAQQDDQLKNDGDHRREGAVMFFFEQPVSKVRVKRIITANIILCIDFIAPELQVRIVFD